MKIGMISLGCAKNLVDSEWVLGLLKKEGHQIIDEIEVADAIIINTCGFIVDSKKESIQTIFDVIDKKQDNAFLIVIGCLAKRYKEELLKEKTTLRSYFNPNYYANPVFWKSKWN